ncbi:hypothetical protein MVEG_11538 [Podila verticillata NRRL 6337]|uniref:3'-5' exonuclease n=1 Tax=Podila verticillata NRRL 6337 TaxID=1069443 RepID=A0A086TK50_9FUNG|nr:hypothetical protein MVEG_11538 [Podila verticillata NRRL 6337]
MSRTTSKHYSTTFGDKTRRASSLAGEPPILYHQYHQYHQSSSSRRVPFTQQNAKATPSVVSWFPPIAKLDFGSSSSSSSNRVKTSWASPSINTFPISGKTTSARATVSNGTSPEGFPSSTSLSPDPPKLPFLHYQTNDSREVLYTRDEDEANKWLSDIKSNLLAFDAEWKPYKIYGPGLYEQGRMSLIQLGDEKTLYLFHICHMKAFPAELSRILRDKRVLKVGINIRADGTKLFKDWGVACASLVELGSLYIQVIDDLNNSRRVRSMDSLARELLGHAVEKTNLTRMGNWERKELTSQQISYAANDVYVTYEVAERIKSLQRAGSPKGYTVPMATIHAKGATLLNVRGTLQHVQDHGVRPRDVIDTPGPTKGSEALSKKVSSTTKTASAKKLPSMSSAWNKKPKAYVKSSPRPSSSTSGPPKIVAIKSIQGSYPGSIYKNVTEIRTIHGHKSTITIIPPKFQKRLLSTKVPSNHEDPKIPEKLRAVGEIYLPKELLPESMEEKDVLERNQAVWLEAGGRDLEEDDEEVAKEASDDWYLLQNQSLYASLASSSEDVGDELAEKTKPSAKQG